MKSILSDWGNLLLSFLLAAALAVTVWVNAVTSADPDEVRQIAQNLPISVSGLGENLVASGYLGINPRVAIRAPQSVWKSLDASQVKVEIDLQDKGEGEYDVPLRAELKITPAMVESIEPATVHVTVEKLKRRTFLVRADLIGSLAPGFAAGTISLTPEYVTVSGPSSQVDRVVEVILSIDVTGLRSNATSSKKLLALDADGKPVSGVTIEPASATFVMEIQQQGGYRDVVVKPVIIGTQKSGYRLTGLSVTPPTVTVYSSDPQLVLDMPGYVETQSVDITNADADVSKTVSLNLPDGISVVGDASVTVTVNISAIEGSITLSCPIRAEGLDEKYAAEFSPSLIDVILSGPLVILRDLTPVDVDVFVNLAGLGKGTHTVTPVVNIKIIDIKVVTISPEQIQVVITDKKP